eukprot:jgi/Chlat1/1878/Chrsp143S02201
MGLTGSRPEAGDVQEEDSDTTAPASAEVDSDTAAPESAAAAATVKLYKYEAASKKWKLVAAPVEPKYEDDALGQREFAWYRKFVQDWQDKLFENARKMEATDANRTRVFASLYDEQFVNWAQGQDEGTEFGAHEEDETEPADVTYDEQKAAQVAGSKASYLEVGALDNSFVIRGSGVDVYRNILNGVQSAGVSVSLRDSVGASITPHKAMLAQRERSLLMLSSERRHSVYQMDIETNNVVTEWAFQRDSKDVPMRDIQSVTKSAQMEDTSTFLGLDDNCLARWDMRVARGVVQQLSAKTVLSHVCGRDYKTNVQFKCMATTGDGCIAVGSDDGKIRLYGHQEFNDKTSAKTTFPGLGSPITAIDVTYNGHWVLATTDLYLLLIDTTYKDKTCIKTGFQAPLRSKLAAPRLLKLHPEDVFATNSAPLRNARLSWVTENGRNERWVVASVGSHAVVWNFARIKDQNDHSCYTQSEGLRNCCYCYSLIPKTEQVVASEFMHANHSNLGDGQLVVATPHAVYSCTPRLSRISANRRQTL